MNPAMLALIISLVEEAVKIAPGIADDLTLIFDNPDPTPADWEALRAKVLAKTYADYVPASALPAASAPAIVPLVETPAAPETPVIAQPGVTGGSPGPSDPQNQPNSVSAENAVAAANHPPAS